MIPGIHNPQDSNAILQVVCDHQDKMAVTNCELGYRPPGCFHGIIVALSTQDTEVIRRITDILFHRTGEQDEQKTI